MPAVFIEQLDEHLTSLDVGRWVVNEACRQLRSWRDQGLHVPRVSVNLFERQFRHPALADEIRATIGQHRLSPGDLEIEITERVAIDPSDAACGSAWKRDPGSGVIGVEKGPLIPVV